jgi:chromosomal replication initiator protein
MDRLSEHTFFLSYAHPDRPQPPDAVLDALVSALRASVAHPDQAVQVLARTTLSEVRCIQEAAWRKLAARQTELNTKRLELLIEQIACALRVEADKLRSRARSQHLAFQRQVAMYLARKISAASFPVIAAAFGRDHSTCICACQVME